MTEQRTCRRCSRAIDAWATICPFCNWDQTSTAEPKRVTPAPVANYTPPEEHDFKRKLMMIGAGLLVLIASFVVGVLVNRNDAPKNAPETVEQMAEEEAAKRAVPPVRRADTPLVPTNERGGFDEPITSAPVAAAGSTSPDDYQRTDATAASSANYAEMARRAKAEKERMAALVDPRSITGPAYAQQQVARPVPRRTTPPPRVPTQTAPPTAPSEPANDTGTTGTAETQTRRTAAARTRPVPTYQPMPRISATGTARLTLTVGTDGRVHEVNIVSPIRGNTAQLLATVQRWRFKPATQNGEPVTAPYTVDISFSR